MPSRKDRSVIEASRKKNVQAESPIADQQVTIPQRYVSGISAGLACVGLVVFLSGYFIGRKDSVDQLVWGIEERSFADRVCLALGTFQDEGQVFGPLALEEEIVVVAGEDVPEAPLLEEATEQDTTRYYAQLVGFGTAQAADLFAQRLQERGLPVLAKRRTSRTPRGAMRTWYQVVTESFDNREKLDLLVDTIARTEKLKGVRVVTC